MRPGQRIRGRLASSAATPASLDKRHAYRSREHSAPPTPQRQACPLVTRPASSGLAGQRPSQRTRRPPPSQLSHRCRRPAPQVDDRRVAAVAALSTTGNLTTGGVAAVAALSTTGNLTTGGVAAVAALSTTRTTTIAADSPTRRARSACAALSPPAPSLGHSDVGDRAHSGRGDVAGWWLASSFTANQGLVAGIVAHREPGPHRHVEGGRAQPRPAPRGKPARRLGRCRGGSGRVHAQGDRDAVGVHARSVAECSEGGAQGTPRMLAEHRAPTSGTEGPE